MNDILKDIEHLQRVNTLFFIIVLSSLLIIAFLVWYNPMFCQYGVYENRCMFEDEYYYLEGL